MDITRAAYEKILKEYDARQLENARALAGKKAQIEAQVPGLSDVQKRITSLYARQAAQRLNGRDEKAEASFRKELSELNAKKDALLKSAGFTAADLEPEFTCSKCRDTGFTGSEPCSCFKARVIEELYDSSHIRTVLEKENFNTFTYKYYSRTPKGTEEKSQLEYANGAVKVANKFIENFKDSDTNIFIYGNTGSGKTFLVNCIAKEIIEQGFSVVYLSAVHFFDVLSERMYKNYDDPSKTDRLEIAGSCDLLIIDDLGTELVNSFTQSALFDCINDRILKGKHTIISSNLSLKELQQNYSERIFSRIISGYRLLKLYGDDIRMKKNLEV